MHIKLNPIKSPVVDHFLVYKKDSFTWFHLIRAILSLTFPLGIVFAWCRPSYQNSPVSSTEPSPSRRCRRFSKRFSQLLKLQTWAKFPSLPFPSALVLRSPAVAFGFTWTTHVWFASCPLFPLPAPSCSLLSFDGIPAGESEPVAQLFIFASF